MRDKPRVLYVGDCAVQTGFGRVNEHLLPVFDEHGWTTYVLAVNYTGDPHPLARRWHLYPAATDRDLVGVGRIAELYMAIRPDLLVLNSDAWVIAQYLRELTDLQLPLCATVAYCPPDGPNQGWAPALNQADMVLATTAWGLEQLKISGFRGEGGVLPHGVDRTIYTPPASKAAARAAMGLPEAFADAWIVGRADRNSTRKRYDLTLEAWAEWWFLAGKPQDAYLMLHCATPDQGVDLAQLGTYLGISGLEKRLLLTGVDQVPGRGVPESTLAAIMGSWNWHLSTTEGEGFGLVALESAACGVAQALPAWAAYGDWAQGMAHLLPVTSRRVHPLNNVIGGIVDRKATVAALQAFYADRRIEAAWAKRALAHVSQPTYDWATVRQTFWDACERAQAIAVTRKGEMHD